MLNEMIEKAKNLIENMRAQGLPEHVCDSSLSLLTSNECQISLENLCENIYEFDFDLDMPTKEQLMEILDFFEIKEHYRSLV